MMESRMETEYKEKGKGALQDGRSPFSSISPFKACTKMCPLALTAMIPTGSLDPDPVDDEEPDDEEDEFKADSLPLEKITQASRSSIPGSDKGTNDFCFCFCLSMTMP
jgi:hypothetical protein